MDQPHEVLMVAGALAGLLGIGLVARGSTAYHVDADDPMVGAALIVAAIALMATSRSGFRVDTRAGVAVRTTRILGIPFSTTQVLSSLRMVVLEPVPETWQWGADTSWVLALEFRDGGAFELARFGSEQLADRVAAAVHRVLGIE